MAGLQPTALLGVTADAFVANQVKDIGPGPRNKPQQPSPVNLPKIVNGLSRADRTFEARNDKPGIATGRAEPRLRCFKDRYAQPLPGRVQARRQTEKPATDNHHV
jgi:hypothetical protein